jgi:hypothetical protein
VWQLVPDVFSLDYKPENAPVRMVRGFEAPADYVWQEHGYWHIGRSQVMCRKYALKEYYNDDMANQLKVNHMEMTFEPAYCKAPGEALLNGGGRMVLVDRRRRDDIVPEQTRRYGVRRVDYVAPGMASEAWAPSLMLEDFSPFSSEPPAAKRRAFSGFGHDIAAACGLAEAAPAEPESAVEPAMSSFFPQLAPLCEEPAAPGTASLEADLSDISAALGGQEDSRATFEGQQEPRATFGSILSSMGGGRGKGKKKQAAAAPEAEGAMPMQE